MEMSLVNYYLEAGNELDFTDKVNTPIRKKLEKKYIIGTDYEKMHKGYVLCISASPSKRVKHIKIHGPHHDRKNKYFNYSVVIPYKEIVNAKDPVGKYTSLVEEGLQMVLAEFKDPGK